MKDSGFTLMEMLLSTAILAFLLAISAPLVLGFFTRNDLDIATNTSAHLLRRAQSLSQANNEDETWGVHFQSGQITLFQGANYATRDAGFDEVFEVSDVINISGNNEYVFNKFNGKPQTTGSTTLTSNEDVRTISVNIQGMVDY